MGIFLSILCRVQEGTANFNTGYLGSKKLQFKNKNMKIEQSFSLFSKYTVNELNNMINISFNDFINNIYFSYDFELHKRKVDTIIISFN